MAKSCDKYSGVDRKNMFVRASQMSASMMKVNNCKSDMRGLLQFNFWIEKNDRSHCPWRIQQNKITQDLIHNFIGKENLFEILEKKIERCGFLRF